MDVQLKTGEILVFPDDAPNDAIARYINARHPEEFADDYSLGEFADDTVKGLQHGGVKAIQGGIGLLNLATGGKGAELIDKGMNAIAGVDNGSFTQQLAEDDAQREASLSANARADINAAQAESQGGFIDAVKSYATHPQALAHGIEESLPSMLGGAAAVRGASALGGLSVGQSMALGAGIEGAQQAGTLAEQAQRDGIPYDQYAAPAIASGVSTGVINAVSGRLFGDIATDLAVGSNTVKGGLLGKIGRGFATEAGEETTQSLGETIGENAAYGREDLTVGLGANAGAGFVMGGVMGAAGGGLSHFTNKSESTSPLGEQILNDETPPDSSQNAPQTPTNESDNLGDLNARIDEILNPASQQNPIQQIAQTDTIDDAVSAFDQSVSVPKLEAPIETNLPAANPVPETEPDIEPAQPEIKYPTKLDDSQESIALLDQFLSSGAVLKGRFLIHENKQVTALSKTQKELAEELLKNERDNQLLQTSDNGITPTQPEPTINTEAGQIQIQSPNETTPLELNETPIKEQPIFEPPTEIKGLNEPIATQNTEVTNPLESEGSYQTPETKTIEPLENSSNEIDQRTGASSEISFDNLSGLIKRPSDNAPFKDAKSAMTRIKIQKLDQEEYSVVPVSGGFAIAPIKEMDYPQFKALPENKDYSDDVLTQTYEALTGKKPSDIQVSNSLESEGIKPIDEQNNEGDLIDNSTPIQLQSANNAQSNSTEIPNSSVIEQRVENSPVNKPITSDVSKNGAKIDTLKLPVSTAKEINSIPAPKNWETELNAAHEYAMDLGVTAGLNLESASAIRNNNDIESVKAIINEIRGAANETISNIKLSPYHPAIKTYANQLHENGGVVINADGSRTQSLNPDWYKSGKKKADGKTFQAYKTVDNDGKVTAFYSGHVSVKEIKNAVDAHEAGKELTARQNGILLALSDVAQAEEDFYNNRGEFSDVELDGAVEVFEDWANGQISTFQDMSVQDFDAYLAEVAKATESMVGIEKIQHDMQALGFSEQEIQEEIKRYETRNSKAITSNATQKESGDAENATGTGTQNAGETPILSQYTNREILAKEEAEKERAAQEALKEKEAAKKEESARSVNTLVDEMLGRSPKTNDLFGGNPLANMGKAEPVKKVENIDEEVKGFGKVETLDHGVLSMPNRTKNINSDLDKYNAEQNKTKARERENKSFLRGEKVKKAKELYAEFNDALIERWKEKYGEKQIKETLSDLAKWQPEKYIKLVDDLKKENSESQQPAINPEIEAIDAEIDSLLDDLGAALIGRLSMKAMPEDNVEIMPIMAKLMGALAKKGYLTFKDNAVQVLKLVRAKFGDKITDTIDIDDLQGGYIAMRRFHEGTDSKQDVLLIDSIDALYSEEKETQQTLEGENNVPSANNDLERNRTDTNASNEGNATPVRNGNGRDAESVRPASVANEAEGNRARVDSSDSVGIAVTGGTRSDNELQDGNEQPLFSERPDGNRDSGRSRNDSRERMEVKRDGTKLAQNIPAKETKGNATSGVTYKHADLENIKAAMPFLNDGQAEDVLKAEIRFDEHKGIMFTNGTGTGKTFSGLGIVKRFFDQGKNNILIVAPSQNILDAWKKAAAKFFGIDVYVLKDTQDEGKGVTATTYANFGDNNALVNRTWDLVVIDEAHYLNQSASGDTTNSQNALRALTNHEKGFESWFKRKYAKEIADYFAAKTNTPEENKAYSDLRDKAKEEYATQYSDSKVVFLSATPFAYDKNVDYAEGYLFNYPKIEKSSGYNQADGYSSFFIQNFGYRMRYNKLTRPDAKVDTSIMERAFNEMLKKSGAVSGRMLDVEYDYDRRFILTESAIGQRIDQALQWLRDTRSDELASYINKKFDGLTRKYVLEAIKAREAVPLIKEQLAAGRKVLVFHDYKKNEASNPFVYTGDTNRKQEVVVSSDGKQTFKRDAQDAKNKLLNEYERFKKEFSDLISSELLNKMDSPIEVLQEAFGDDVLIYNGDVPSKERIKRVAQFNDDNSGKNLILAQSASAKEGVSFHDTTGKHRRVLFNIGLPTAPTTAIQQEGRIYRVGQKSDAMFRYLSTGTNWERWAFAQTIAARASSAENLALGEQARGLRDAFIDAYEMADAYPVGHEGEGKGGKERDRKTAQALTEMDRAKSFYFGQQKKTSKNKSAEGVDYFATPEPVGLVMSRLADARIGEDMLEPSAGHGAIARWFRQDANRTAIEPSVELASRLALSFQDGKILPHTFEDLHVVNKYDAIVMNPPFGTGGKTAVEHLEKAFKHLRDGGRIVALLPEGGMADKRLDAFLNVNDNADIKPLATTEIGDVYEGDIIVYTGFVGQGRSRKIEKTSLKVKSVSTVNGVPSMIQGSNFDQVISLRSIEEIKPTGKRQNVPNKQLVYDISLPTVTFERAGTKVKSHIIVIEKTTDDIATTQINLSDISDINNLFDEMDGIQVEQRLKPVEESEISEGAKDETLGELTDRVNQVVTYTTKKDKVLKGKLRPDMNESQAKAIDPYSWNFIDPATKKKVGWFIREEHWEKLNDGSDEQTGTTEDDGNFHSIHAEENTPQRTRISNQIKKLISDFDNGSIANEQLTQELSKLHNELESQNNNSARGASSIRKTLEDAKQRGDISEDAANLAEWFISQNESLADDLGISIIGQNQSPLKNSAGYYSPVNRILTLIKGNAKDSTAVHEMLHHLERLMPEDLQAGIRNEWLKQTLTAYKKATGLHADYFEAALSGNQQRALKILHKIGDKNQKLYRFINASEFWAVNSTEILQNRFHAKSSAIGRVKQWLREFVQYVRKTFGFASHSPLLDTLDYLLNQSNGEKQANRMLSQDKGYFYADRNDDYGLPNPNKKDIFERTEQAIRNSKIGMQLNKIPHWFTAMGTLADRDDYLIERYKTLGRIDSVDRLVHEIFSTLRKASKDDAAAIYDFLTTKDALPNEIHDQNLRMAAKNVKDVIITIGEKMVERGLITQEVYEANKGAYLPRLYLKHILGNELYESIGTGKNLSDLGYLKKRKDIPEEVRRLWLMEIKNPAYLASRSISVTMRDLAVMNFFDQIANNEKWVWKQSLITIEVDDENKPTAIFDKDGNIDYKKTQKAGDKLGKSTRRVTPYFLSKEAERMRRQSVAAPTEDKAEIRALADLLEQAANNAIDEMTQEGTPKDFVQMPDNARYGALRGLVIRKEIYDDLVGVFSMTQGQKGWAEQWLGDMGVLAHLSGFFKTTHVVLNPPTQIVNFISNLSMVHLSGVAFHQVPLRMVQALKEVIHDGKHYQALVDMGGNKATFSNQELRRMNEYLLEAEAEKSGEWSWHDIQLLAAKVLYFGNKIVTTAGNVHQFMEMWSKTAVVIDKMEKGMTAEKAVLAAHDALIDYSLVSRNVRYLRNVPLGAPFITFFVKSTEILLDTAINKPWKFLPYYMTLYAMQVLVASMAGTDKDDVDKLSELLPEWMREKGHAYILPFKDSRGYWQGMDFSKFLPWGTQAAMANLVAHGEPAKALEQIGLLGSPIVGIATAIKTNTDSFTHKPIVDKYGSPIEQIGDGLRYAYNTFAPPFLKLNEKNQVALLSSVKGELNKYGELKKTSGQAAASFLGANVSSITPLSREQALARFDFEIADIKRNWSHEKNDKNLSSQDRKEIDEIYQKRIERVKNEKTKYLTKTSVSKKILAMR